MFGAGVGSGLDEEGESGLGEDEGAFAGLELAMRTHVYVNLDFSRRGRSPLPWQNQRRET
jgi:hypothetical protein